MWRITCSDKFGHPDPEVILNTWTQEQVHDAHAVLDMFDELASKEYKQAVSQRSKGRK